MTPYVIYYISFLIAIIFYFNIIKHYRPLTKITRKIIYIKRTLIISFYIIGISGLILMYELEGDTIFNFVFLISSVIIFLICMYLTYKLEYLKN
ncbi:hypothetical protein OO9_05312 [Providencia alcalifaciens Dmel2]|nr:hypothetical protein OO9_05312 [Providencia alcalifaciens Dmel2]